MSDSTSSDDGGLAETSARLRAAIGSQEEGVDDGDASVSREGTDDVGNADSTESTDSADSAGDSGGSADDEDDGDAGIDSDLAEAAELVTRAEADLEDILAISRGDREGTFEDVQDDFDDLLDVIDEAEDLLSTIDLSALPGAVEWRSLPAAIEAGDIPEAIAEGEAGKAVHFRKLLQVVNLRKVLGNVDLRDLWREKEDLEEAADDLTDDDSADSTSDSDEDSSVLDRLRDDGDDGNENDEENFLDRFRSDDENDGDTEGDEADNGDEEEGGGIPSEIIQAKVQSRLREAIDEFRESAIEARSRLKEMTERSKQEFKRKTGETGQPSSRSPTAYSTLPSSSDDRTDLGGVARFSTMSRTPRHSSAPGRDHIYGDRFENRNGGDDDE